MHLYIITRGIKHDSDRFIDELRCKYLPYKFHDGKDKLIDCSTQIGVRPIMLYEVVFPEAHKDLVMASILDPVQHKRHNKFIFAIRKILGVQKVGEYKTDRKMPVYKENVEVNAIGIKTDYWTDPKTKKRYYHPTEEQKKKCWEGL